MRWRLSLLALLVLTGCADAGLERMEDLPLTAHWCDEERPATILVSDALPPECALSICAAARWWATQGVSYLNCASVPDDQLTPGTPQPRFISVVTTPPEDPGATGDTRLHRITADCIDAAEVRIDPYFCGKGNTEAHELGHALGLVHVDDPSNLMWPANLPGRFGLTVTQVEHVR